MAFLDAAAFFAAGLFMAFFIIFFAAGLRMAFLDAAFFLAVGFLTAFFIIFFAAGLFMAFLDAAFLFAVGLLTAFFIAFFAAGLRMAFLGAAFFLAVVFLTAFFGAALRAVVLRAAFFLGAAFFFAAVFLTAFLGAALRAVVFFRVIFFAAFIFAVLFVAGLAAGFIVDAFAMACASLRAFSAARSSFAAADRSFIIFRNWAVDRHFIAVDAFFLDGVRRVDMVRLAMFLTSWSGLGKSA